MKTPEIKPLEGIDKIKLGLTKEEVRNIMGEPSEDHGEIISPDNAEFYKRNGLALWVYYNEDEKAEYIEIPKTGKKSQVTLNGIDLFQTPAEDVVAKITTGNNTLFDTESSDVPFSYIFPQLELFLWRPTIPEDYEENEPEDEYEKGKFFRTIGIGTKGYYSN